MQKQLIIDRLREQLAKAEADRDVLAAEVREWRNKCICRVNHATVRTDASGALTRAKEAK